MKQEIKTIEVDPASQEKMIKKMQTFGWRLKSNQHIFNQDTSPTGAVSYNSYTYIHTIQRLQEIISEANLLT